MEKVIEKIQDDPINLKAILEKVSRNWLLFGISIVTFLIIVFFINTFSLPVYNVRTTLLISETEESTPLDDISSAFGTMSLFPTNRSFDNEIIVLKSTPIIKNALNGLNFNVTYFEKEKLGYKEKYKLSPFIVVFNKEQPQPIDLNFYIKIINDEQFELKVRGKDIEIYDFTYNQVINEVPNIKIKGVFNFNTEIEYENFSFKLLMNKNILTPELSRKKYYFTFNGLSKLVYNYQQLLVIESINENATLANVSIQTNNVNKTKDFLNAIIKEYTNKNLDKRNFIAENTIDYIDNQLAVITDSLQFTERKLQNFQANNEVMDISLKSERLYQQLQELQIQKEALNTKISYFQYTLEDFESDKDISDLLAPSSMAVDDPLLNNMIQELITLNNEKNNLIDNNQQKSPYLATLNIKIENLKNAIYENIKYVLNTSQLTLKDINSKINQINFEINKLPKTSRELLGITRKFTINDNIYTYLLQRKAESEISKASTLPTIEVVEPPDVESPNPIKPRKSINYLIGLILGIIFPSLFILIKSYFNDDIQDRKDIEKHTDFPILGNIMHNPKDNEKVMLKFPKSSVAESFRHIRTNLQFFSKGNSNQVILITSCFGGEGKTFNAYNLAASLAQFGKKTILLDFDLRKPKLSEQILMPKGPGISSYMINTATLNDIVTTSEIENLNFIPAGEVPPNPVELIASEKTNQIINELKKQYDYVIIDSPPIGLVTDAYLLTKSTDLNILVARQDYTSLREFCNVLKDIKNKDINHLSILLNDVKGKRGRYGYGYYQHKKKGFLSTLTANA